MLKKLFLHGIGRIFHIDFSYIFGKDPKFFPPLMKLIQEMICAMGGTSSESFEVFNTYICAKYVTLRKYAKSLISLISLAANSGLYGNDIDFSCVLMVQDRLKLDNTSEEAARLIQVVVSDSIGSIIPNIMDKFHKLAQMLR